MAATIPLIFVSAVLGAISVTVWAQSRRLKRAEFIRTAPWPPGLLDRLAKRRPGLTRKECALVAEGLRQFFLAYLNSGRRYVAMPSQVADDLWHEFILHTKAYEQFCQRAFGRFLHHTPAVALSATERGSNEGLRRAWYWACREENINIANPTRLPLLFALDRKLRIPGGFEYTANCEALRRNGVAGAQCGGDFASSSVDGSTAGIDGGTGSDSGGGDGGGDGGGGCGGGD